MHAGWTDDALYFALNSCFLPRDKIDAHLIGTLTEFTAVIGDLHNHKDRGQRNQGNQEKKADCADQFNSLSIHYILHRSPTRLFLNSERESRLLIRQFFQQTFCLLAE